MFFTRLLLLFFLVWLQPHCIAQGKSMKAKMLFEKISSKQILQQSDIEDLFATLNDPTVNRVAMAADCQTRLQPVKLQSQVAFNMALVNVFAQHISNDRRIIELVQPFLDTLLRQGFSSNDIRQQALASWIYGSTLLEYQRLDEGATYSLFSIHLFEELPFFERIYAYYGSLAEILFHAGDYRPSIEYGRKALIGEAWLINKYERTAPIRYLNTMGQAYHRLGLRDSSAMYYQKSKQLAARESHAQWMAINASFEGQLYLEKRQPNQALVLFEEGYRGNRGIDPPMESYSLAGMGKTLLSIGKPAAARVLLWQSLDVAMRSPLGQRWQVADYRRDALATLAELYRKQNQQDSFYYYAQAALQLKDSMLQMASLSNFRTANSRSQVHQYQLQAATLEAKQSRDRLMRNFLIAGIVLVASVFILLLSRQNRILQLQKQMDQLKHQAADAEIAAAREQLNQFTRSLQEKSQLLEQLQQQANVDDIGFQIKLMQDLTRQTILTEAEWQHFKTSFDKIYPSFFIRLRQQATDITKAEQRMAALTMLQINSKEMAAILGISPDSVRKTKQRLRQRLQLKDPEDMLERLTSLV